MSTYNEFAVYIVQDEDGIRGVHTLAFSDYRAEGESADILWPGYSEVDAVQRLHDKHPYYEGDEFIVGEVEATGRPNVMVRVRVTEGEAHRFDLMGRARA